MKYITTGILLIIATLSAASLHAGDCLKLESDGHKVEMFTRTSIETNETINGINATNFICCITNGYAINYSWRPEPEKPFPRESEDTHTFEVRSNVYAYIVLDGQTNQTATASTVLGTISRTTKTTITAATNVLTCENFKPSP